MIRVHKVTTVVFLAVLLLSACNHSDEDTATIVGISNESCLINVWSGDEAATKVIVAREIHYVACDGHRSIVPWTAELERQYGFDVDYIRTWEMGPLFVQVQDDQASASKYLVLVTPECYAVVEVGDEWPPTRPECDEVSLELAQSPNPLFRGQSGIDYYELREN